MLDKEFSYYLDHQNELLKTYSNRFLVIIGEKVVADYGSMAEAYAKASSKYELGTFLIQECTPGEEAYTQTFHSMVAFG
ncbi:MAG: hypothetical protein FWF51_01575 [Chitinivibrionia bacterium]|nr:hypothetical protein [Chitinivibrionia bacterium]